MGSCFANSSNKIWIFWYKDIECSIYASEDQMVTYRIINNINAKEFFLSVVYAKSKSTGREFLWGYMRTLASTTNSPWAVCGDFNSILTMDEKFGGKPHRIGKSIPFIECLHDCGLMDIGYSGNRFTWCNERKEDKIIWKRLDRMLVNDKWNDLFANSEVIHLPRVSSDHCPLLITCGNGQENYIKYFKFLNFWVDQPDFLDIVKDNWKFQTNEKELGDVVEQSEEQFLTTLDPEDKMKLHKGKADFIVHHKYVDSFWRQKENLKWQVEGDENSKFLHSVVRGRRSIVNINRIQTDGIWIEGDNEIGQAVVDFYQKLSPMRTLPIIIPFWKIFPP
ncbi:uncharacterized protein LOC132599797 [Lycium barbarum]|uniref:uncharacterized protein LOC132599797 n=1 Tax=Lycium barbarum TaxID=112863 RepID=UPI00293F3068|nr:uncharacterized protein LOC132599797 [Lycium barbarum]